MSCDKACEADGFCTPVSLNRTKAEDDSELGMVCPEYLNANKIDLTPLLRRQCFPGIGDPPEIAGAPLPHQHSSSVLRT